jgi:hypothetical protein
LQEEEVLLRFETWCEKAEAAKDEDIKRIVSLNLGDPLSAFLLAWEVEHGNVEWLVSVEEAFREFLEQRYEQIGFRNSRPAIGRRNDDHGSPLVRYVVILSWLVSVWRKERPDDGACGSVAAHWCERHPDIWNKIQTALRKRTSLVQIQSDKWEARDWAPGGPAFQLKNTHRTFIREERFTAAMNWADAAQTAAYALFGDFLTGHPQKIGFCAICELPFWRGSGSRKKRFCSVKCGSKFWTYAGRDSDAAKERRRLLLIATKELRRLIEKRKITSDWRRKVEHASGFSTSDRGLSRVFHEFVVAAETRDGSPQREKLLASLTNHSKLDQRGRDETQRMLNKFLADINAALNLTREVQNA